MNKYKIIITIFYSSIFADDVALQNWFIDVNNHAKPVNVAVVPNLPHFETKKIISNDLFSLDRQNIVAKTKNYKSDQLVMVGYMKYKNIDYAFIKTQDEIIKVKKDDHIMNSQIALVLPDSVLIDQHQETKNKKYVIRTKLNLKQ